MIWDLNADFRLLFLTVIKSMVNYILRAFPIYRNETVVLCRRESPRTFCWLLGWHMNVQKLIQVISQIDQKSDLQVVPREIPTWQLCTNNEQSLFHMDFNMQQMFLNHPRSQGHHSSVPMPTSYKSSHKL